MREICFAKNLEFNVRGVDWLGGWLYIAVLRPSLGREKRFRRREVERLAGTANESRAIIFAESSINY